MTHRNLLYDKKEGIVRLTINRPEKLNALNRETIQEIADAIGTFQADREALALILTGGGEKAFVAGADIKELAEQTPQEGKEYSLFGQGVLGRLERSGKPTIAAINGFALGGGLEVALACHIRVASRSARLGLPEVTLGLIPGFGGTQRLPRLIGRSDALKMILTGDMIEADEALRLGLVSSVVAPEELDKEAEGIARRIVSRGPLAVRYAIEAVNSGLEMPLAEGLFLEAGLFGLLGTTEDTKEGTRAFLEKRKPSFRGR